MFYIRLTEVKYWLKKKMFPMQIIFCHILIFSPWIAEENLDSRLCHSRLKLEGLCKRIQDYHSSMDRQYWKIFQFSIAFSIPVEGNISSMYISPRMIFYPLLKAKGYRFGTVCLPVRPFICPSFHLSVTLFPKQHLLNHWVNIMKTL